MRAGFGVDAFVGQTQALDRPAAHQVLFHDLCGVSGLHMAVPDGFGVNHYRWSMFALVKAHGFVDAHGSAKTGGFRQLLQLGMKLAFPIGSARWAGRIGGTGVMTDKNVVFERGQAVFLLGADDWYG
jgi:hypothetical protein